MNIVYKNDLHIIVIADYHYKLYDDFIVQVDDRTFTVPSGFETDFASVPRFLFAYLIAGGRAHHAAVIHDWLYVATPPDTDKAYADNVFYECLKINPKVNRLTAWLMYRSVRMFGKGNYK